MVKNFKDIYNRFDSIGLPACDRQTTDRGTDRHLVAPRLPVAPTSMGSSSGFLPGGRTMVRSGLQGVRGPLGAVASIDSGVLSIGNGSVLRSCEYDQQRVNIYMKSLFTYVQYTLSCATNRTSFTTHHQRTRIHVKSLTTRINSATSKNPFTLRCIASCMQDAWRKYAVCIVQ